MLLLYIAQGDRGCPCDGYVAVCGTVAAIVTTWGPIVGYGVVIETALLCFSIYNLRIRWFDENARTDTLSITQLYDRTCISLRAMLMLFINIWMYSKPGTNEPFMLMF